MRSLLLAACLLLIQPLPAQDHTRFVNPFIGTAKSGNTFPGALRPWGMVSVSPHTDLRAPSGYLHGAPWFYGFGHVHLSGTGCADLGSVIVTAVRDSLKVLPEAYRSTYADEKAEPGYYSVTLHDAAFHAEATATGRCSLLRFASLKEGQAFLLVDAGRSLALVGGGMVKWVTPTELEGFNTSGGFCGEDNEQQVYFVVRFQRTPQQTGLWVDDTLTSARTSTVVGRPLGAWAMCRCSAADTLLVKVGISYVSTENARKNLDMEIPEWDFGRVRREGRDAWEKALGRVRVEGGTDENMTKFYTALYHMLIHPNIISDVNGEYPLMGRKGVGQYTHRDRYTVFSLWDTYRTLHPFLTLVYPERQAAIVQTMLDMYRESGWLPKWEIAGNETHMMVGDPALPVIADTYIKGVKGFDASTAYDAMLKHATDTSAAHDPVRPGHLDYLHYGYIPFEQDTTQTWWVWGPVSTTLEYCLADWSLARMAQKMGRNEQVKELDRRAAFYRNLFNPDLQFIMPRRKNGTWLTPFNPLATEGSGSWSGSGGPGYVEGNAWNYTWFVPHDVLGLAKLFGSDTAFTKKLVACFDNGQFTINNEPDIAYPYLFTYVKGEEWRTPALVRWIMDHEFGAGPEGLPGNDDAGAISAWFAFSALGLYPACPAAEYRLGVPLFRKATVTMGDQSNSSFTVELIGEISANAAVAGIRLNGKDLHGWAVAHDQLIAGGRLEFITGKSSVKQTKEEGMFTLTCQSYPDGGTIPAKYVHRKAKGENVSPSFTWQDPPTATKSFALTIVDPHPVANNWIHWMVIDIPFRERALPEGVSRSNKLPPGVKEMRNSFGDRGYGGPAPPRSSGRHPYVATLYALNVDSLKVPEDATLRQFEKAIEGKVIEEKKVTGYFEQK